MGFFERAIRNGIRKGIGDAIGQAVKQAVEPAATDLANKAADAIENNARNVEDARQSAENTILKQSGLEAALSNFARSVEGYANEAAKNTKICPKCGQPSSSDKKFCPGCGTKLPEVTLAEGAVCPSCGKQNAIGTKFCSDCGTKLPAAIEEERAEAARGEAVMADWDSLLAVYPKWSCGGSPANIEDYGSGNCVFAVDFKGNSSAARQAVEQYRQVLLQNGFKQAGQYPSGEHLYKKVGDICYGVDTEHCFDGDPDCPTIGFAIGEPYGGFGYVKPEPKKEISLRDLFKF